MCGIIGYDGDADALPVVAAGLKNLEYRGYDSAGIALRDDALAVYKQAGVIDDLELPDASGATCGIGHTRWSTHGEPTDANAHPHVDCEGEVAVVHNGIIDNYEALRDALRERGHRFSSETDTEVVPHLVEERLAGGADLRAAVEATVDELEGSFAIVAVAGGFDGIVAARQDSPLVLGHGDGANFVASDVTALLEHTRRVSYPEDGDVVHVTDDGIRTWNGEGVQVERDVQTVEWEADAAEKGGFEHYMLKEIHEQPAALRQTLSGRVDVMQAEADLAVDLPAEYLRSLEEVQVVAAGTSYHAGMYAATLLEEYADVRATVHVASEYEFRGGRDPWRTLVVGVSQSGETADTLRAVRRANRAGARTLAVTNTVGSTITRETDDAVYIRAGPEIGVAATKTFASQVATLALLTVYVGRERGSLPAERAEAILSDLRGLPGAVQQVLDSEDAVREAAREFGDGDAFFFIGRGLGHPVSLEGALKLKEISYDHAEGFPGGELKHGPLALVTPGTPVLAVLTDGTHPEETVHNVTEVASRGAPVIGLSSLDEPRSEFDVEVAIPELGVMEPLVANVYLQLFAYHVADMKGRGIDKPRNLAKSVTVE